MNPSQLIGIPANNPIRNKQYGAGIVTNPRHMPRCFINGAGLTYKNGAGTNGNVNSNTPPDWNAVNFNGNTSRTNVVTISGTSGIVTHVRTPYISSGAANSISIWFNVDGIITPFIMPSVVGSSWLFGTVIEGTSPETTNSATYGSRYLQKFGSPTDGGHSSKSGVHPYMISAGADVIIPSIYQIMAWGFPRLRFENFFSLDMQCGIAPANGSAGDYAMIGYCLD